MKKVKFKDISILCALIVFIGVIFLIYLFHKGTQAIFYGPVINHEVHKIAFVKRLLDYKVEGSSLLPFIGQPPRIHVKSDRLQICERTIHQRKDKVLHDWPIILDATDSLGSVWVRLDWHQEKLKYEIRLTDYGHINLGIQKNGSSGLEWILTNVENNESIQPGPTQKDGLKVLLNADPERIRFPYANKIIFENQN